MRKPSPRRPLLSGIVAQQPHKPSDIAADNFIDAAGGEKDGKRIAVLVRFNPALLRQVDKAARKRGVSRAAWVQFCLSRTLEAGEG